MLDTFCGKVSSVSSISLGVSFECSDGMSCWCKCPACIGSTDVEPACVYEHYKHAERLIATCKN